MKIIVGYELDNASALDEIKTVELSLQSVLEALRHFSNISQVKTQLVLTRTDTSSQDLMISLGRICDNFPDISVLESQEIFRTYYAAKNSIATLAEEEDVLIFCDSDCQYALDYFCKMINAFSNPEINVVYGTTYINLVNCSALQRAMSLVWQFPPEDLGYNRFWGSSRWENNLGVRAKILRLVPFSEVFVSRPKNIQIKIEGVLWASKLKEMRIESTDAHAINYHRIFSNLSEFSSRQFEHGVAEKVYSRLIGRSSLISVIAPLGFIRYKLRLLAYFLLKKKITLSEFFSSIFLIVAASNFRLIGSIFSVKSIIRLDSK